MPLGSVACKMAGGIPGAVKVGKQWRFDARNPEFKKWVAYRKSRVGSKRTPNLLVSIGKLRDAILHCEPDMLSDKAFIPLTANLVRLAYTELLEVDPKLGKELLNSIGAFVEDSDWQREQARKGRVLGTDGRTAPRMNGKRILC